MRFAPPVLQIVFNIIPQCVVACKKVFADSLRQTLLACTLYKCYPFSLEINLMTKFIFNTPACKQLSCFVLQFCLTTATYLTKTPQKTKIKPQDFSGENLWHNLQWTNSSILQKDVDLCMPEVKFTAVFPTSGTTVRWAWK